MSFELQLAVMMAGRARPAPRWWRSVGDALSERGCLQRYKMRRATFLLIVLAISGQVSPGYAVPVVAPDPPMSADRIARLPPEIRRAVVARCGADAEAGHYFATYDANSTVVRLDYSLLHCPTAPEHCKGSSCVQTFVRHGGKYVLSSGRHSSRPHSRRDLALQFPPKENAVRPQ